MARPKCSLCRALIFRTGGTSLTIAQRFNAGFSNEVKIESRRGTKEILCRPDGIQQRETHGARGYNAGLFSVRPEYMRRLMASNHVAPESVFLRDRSQHK